MAKYRGTGKVAAGDYKSVKWEGLTKGGNAVTITMAKALNMSNIDLTFAEKNDTVAQLVFTGVYSNTNAIADDTTEPWTIEVTGSDATVAGNIVLGVGKFYINDTLVALTRGGGQFTVEREFRPINADGDRGPVEGRIVIEGSTATLTMNTLEFLTNISEVYAGVETVS